MPTIFFPLAADIYSGGCNEYLSCLLTLFLPNRYTGYSKYMYAEKQQNVSQKIYESLTCDIICLCFLIWSSCFEPNIIL